MMTTRIDAFRQVVQHGMSGEMHQVAAVDERNELDAGRQNVVIQLVDFGVDPRECLIAHWLLCAAGRCRKPHRRYRRCLRLQR